jgi:hypothetical protein
MIKRTLVALAAAAVLALPGIAQARSVTVSYSGTITQVGAELNTSFNLIGAPFSGTATTLSPTRFTASSDVTTTTATASYYTRDLGLTHVATVTGFAPIETTGGLLALRDRLAGSATGTQSNEDIFGLGHFGSAALTVGIDDFGFRMTDATGTVLDSGLFAGGVLLRGDIDRGIPRELLALGPNVDLTQFDADRFPDFFIDLLPESTRTGSDGNSVFGNCPLGAGTNCGIKGNITAMSITVSAVPLPAGGLLLAGGLIAAAALRRRAHRKAA